MISEIIKTLSDTELVAVATEINDPRIDNRTIYNQLLAKANLGVNMNGFDKLTNLVVNELVIRLLQCDRKI
jgi:hypothetical protein